MKPPFCLLQLNYLQMRNNQPEISKSPSSASREIPESGEGRMSESVSGSSLITGLTGSITAAFFPSIALASTIALVLIAMEYRPLRTPINQIKTNVLILFYRSLWRNNQ